MPHAVDFYFDFMSPYAYLAHHALCAATARHGWTIAYQPIDLTRAKLAVGNDGPANREMPIKHRYLRIDLKRWADRYGLPFVPPSGYGSERLNCGAFYAQDRDCCQSYVREAWLRVWGQGGAMDDDRLLGEVAQAMGWSPADFLEFVNSETASRRLVQSNLDATAHGIFGVPMMAIGDQLWWGNDRMQFVEEFIQSQSVKVLEAQ